MAALLCRRIGRNLKTFISDQFNFNRRIVLKPLAHKPLLQRAYE
jgi:hypothetical protein